MGHEAPPDVSYWVNNGFQSPLLRLGERENESAEQPPFHDCAGRLPSAAAGE